MYTDLATGKLLGQDAASELRSAQELYGALSGGPPRTGGTRRIDLREERRGARLVRMSWIVVPRPALTSTRGSASGLADKAPQAPRPAVVAVSVPSSHAWKRFRGTSQRRPTR